MSTGGLRITLLADEWKSSKGGLSTMNRELAIQFAKHPNVTVTLFVSKCTEEDKKAARSHNINIVEAQEWPGFESIDCLCFPPRDLVIDIIVGHGVKLGKQAQAIKYYHYCTWVQVVHTSPEELAMYKNYPDAISKGDEKQWNEVNLCKKADLVVAVGPKLWEVYSRYVSSIGKSVFNLTPGIFTDLTTLRLSTQESKKFWVLVFGRGDSKDFELKGFDIAAKAVAELSDRSYQLIFVGAPSGNERQVAEKLLEQGLKRSQLTVKGYLENRDDLATLLSTADLAIIPSRTEGFGLTALEALSAGLPFLVSQNSGFGEALEELPSGSSWIVNSEDPVQWAKAIKGVREKGRDEARKECQELRTQYAETYSWEKQCNDLVEMMAPLVYNEADVYQTSPVKAALQNKGTGQPKLNAERSIDEAVSVRHIEIQSYEVEPKIFTVFVKARKIEVSDVETKYHVNILREIIGACGQVSLIPKDTCSPEEYNTACDVFIELYQQLMQALSVERFWLKSGSSAIIALKKVREMRRQFPVLLEEGEDLTNWYLYGEKQHLEEALKFLENEKVEIKRE